MKNYYGILELESNATQLEIKKTYRRLVKIHHPDVGGSEEIVKAIIEAYETLSNYELRSSYDATLRQENSNNNHNQEEQSNHDSNATQGEPSYDNSYYTPPEHLDEYTGFFRRISMNTGKLHNVMNAELKEAAKRILKSVNFDLGFFNFDLERRLGNVVLVGYYLYLTEQRMWPDKKFADMVQKVRAAMFNGEDINYSALDNREKIVEAFSAEFHHVGAFIVNEVIGEFKQKIPVAEYSNFLIALEDCLMLGYALGIRQDSTENKTKIEKHERGIRRDKIIEYSFRAGIAVMVVVLIIVLLNS